MIVRLIGLFVFGLLLLSFAVQQLFTFWTTKSSLISLTGTLENSDTYVTTVSASRRYGSDTKSQKAGVIFYLKEHKKEFVLQENIGDDFRNDEQARINQRLKSADSVTVWIKKSQLDFWKPKILQIETDREKLLDIETVRFKQRPLTIFLLLIGVGSIFFAVYVLYLRILKKHEP